MASLCCSCHPQISNLKIKRRVPVQNLIPSFRIKSTSAYSFEVASKFESASSFLRGSIIVPRPKTAKFVPCKTGLTVSASWIPHSVIASNAFTMGTVAILPFYALMILAPKSNLTKKFMDSTVPYLLLGILYGYLLYLSWTPDTLRLMFASKYWLPELNGMVKMFSSEMTMASAWIHLLVVDLFAARQVYHDGLKNEIETRHSVSLCLLFCPVGIITHVITKFSLKKDRVLS